MSVDLFLNIIVILLLIPTIVFALLLNRRLEILRSSRADLGRLIEAFNDATTRAEAGIPRLKQAADSTGALLKEQIQKAQTLRDDLSFMLERADTMLNRLDESARRLPQKRPVANDADEEPRSVGRKDIGSAKGQPSSFSSDKTKSRHRAFVEDPEELMSSAVSVAEDILRETERAKAREERPFVPAADDDGERSEAERELLRALQAMR